MSIELLAVIGDLEVANRRLMAQVEKLQARVAELESKEQENDVRRTQD